MSNFSADVGGWVAQAKERLIAVRNESAQRVVSEMQKPRSEGGHMRIDTGFLRASLQGSSRSMPKVNRSARPEEGWSYGYGASQIALVIATSKPEDTLYFGYTASYAEYREYEDGFVRLAAQNWQSIVRKVATEARSRSP